MKASRVYQFYLTTTIYRDSNGEHDSVSVKDNRWFDHKNQVGGYTISFLEEFYGLSFKEAMKDLLNNELPQISLEVYEKPKKEFKLPEKSQNINKVYDYLVDKRFIAKEIVDFFVLKGKIYQGFQYNNIVFVGTDKNGNPKSACAKSVSNSFRSSVKGSDMEYGFCHRGTNGNLYVFESAVDMLSFMTLKKTEKGGSYIALDGLSPKAMMKFLDEQENINRIYICIDNDMAGIEASDKLKDLLEEKGYENIQRLVSKNKDWNEDLKELNGLKPQEAKMHPKINQYKTIAEKMIKANENISSEYNKVRNQYVESHGLKFLTSTMYGEIRNIYKALDDEKSINSFVVRLIDLSLTAYCFIEKNENYNDVIRDLSNDYKPYLDKTRIRKRMSSIEQSVCDVKNEFQETGICESGKILDIVDYGIRLKVYSDLELEEELQQVQQKK